MFERELRQALFTLDGIPLTAIGRPGTEIGSWHKGRTLDRGQLLGQHELCLRVGEPTRGSLDQPLDVPLAFTLLEAPYDDFQVVAPFTARIRIAPPAAIDRWRPLIVLERLRRELAGDRRITFRRESGARSWRQHANTLIERCRTPLFSLLPQDDDITPGYYERLQAVLDRLPSAGLAFGRIRSIGRPRRYLQSMARPPIPLGRDEPWREAIELDRRWNLGIPWRGVVRRELLLPMAPTPDDRFADQIWVFGIALAAHLAEAPDAIYVKRYHARNTHSDWAELTPEERRSAQVAEIRRRVSDPAVAAAARMALDEGSDEPGGVSLLQSRQPNQ